MAGEGADPRIAVRGRRVRGISVPSVRFVPLGVFVAAARLTLGYPVRRRLSTFFVGHHLPLSAGLVDDRGFADTITGDVAGREEFFVTNSLSDVTERREVPSWMVEL